MNLILVLVVVVALAVLAVALGAVPKRQVAPKSEPEYEQCPAFLTPAERSFFGVAKLAVGNAAEIMAKVRVADVLVPQKGLENSDRQRAFNRVSAKHFDFVLCDPKTMSVRCAVELDDSSHQRKHRRDRDAFLDAACRGAGLPLVRVPAQAAYAAEQVAALFAPHLSAEVRAVRSVEMTAVAVGAKKLCPKCGTELVLRTAKRGENAGSQFWACNAFPKCRYSANTAGK